MQPQPTGLPDGGGETQKHISSQVIGLFLHSLRSVSEAVDSGRNK